MWMDDIKNWTKLIRGKLIIVIRPCDCGVFISVFIGAKIIKKSTKKCESYRRK